MSATGTSYRIHTYEADGLGALGYVLAGGGYKAWLIPAKKVLRDTKVNQHTCALAMDMGPAFLGTGHMKIALYRWERPVDLSTAGLVVASKVTNSEVSTTAPGGMLTTKTDWDCSSVLNLEGGGYWWLIGVYLDGGVHDTAIVTAYGITDADANILYPKYHVSLAAPLTFPTTITTTSLTRNTTDWIHISSEWA